MCLYMRRGWGGRTLRKNLNGMVRIMIRRDEVEKAEEYQQAMKEIQPVLDREFPDEGIILGTCHRYWARKKALLAGRGIEWKSPAEMNPEVHFD